MVKVAINGFGRIGRAIFRCSYNNPEFDIIAINDIASAENLAYMLKYDSVFGIFDEKVDYGKDYIEVAGKKIKVTAIRAPKDLPWKQRGVEIVIESTGLFRKREDAKKHLEAGAKKVLISAPAKDPDITLVLGVNDDKYDSKQHNIISNASCTTNCVAPVAKVINDNFGILKGDLTTIHSYTGDQAILDGPHKKDLRRGRAAAVSMIPTSTGAAKALGIVIEELQGKVHGIAIRVPTPNVSLIDLILLVEKNTSEDEVKDKIKKTANGDMNGILGYSNEPLVSSDYIGDSRSSIVDMDNVSVIKDNLLKIVAWYDNEWGYSCRMRDLAIKVAKEL